jgi:tetratricopeptide (TPR) repeat protein
MSTLPRPAIAGRAAVLTNMVAGIPERRLARMLDTALEHHQAGRLGKALSFYRKYLKRRPDDADALNQAGIAAFDSGETDAALRWLNAAKDSSPSDPQSFYNLGLVYQSLGRLDDALDAYTRAAVTGSGVASTHYNMGVVLTQMGKFDDALAALDHAIKLDPDHGKAYASKGYIRRMQGRADDSAALYNRASALAPGDPALLGDLGMALRDAGCLTDAASAFDRALSIDPDYAESTSNFADVLLRLDQPRDALAVCDAYLARHPYHASVLAAKTVVLNEVGEGAAAVESAELVDFDRFVAPIQHDGAPGFQDLEAFNTALADHILAHPTLVTAPTSNATRLGKHSGELTTKPKGPIATFETLIRRAFEGYTDRVCGAAALGHPYAANPPKRWGLNVWSIVLEGEGYQLPHIHRAAWMSGVYYARVPDIVHDGSRAGWIEFGRPGPEYHWTAEPDTRAYQPAPGLMVLFPSYMFHETIPFESSETRISIAFDIVPEG